MLLGSELPCMVGPVGVGGVPPSSLSFPLPRHTPRPVLPHCCVPATLVSVQDTFDNCCIAGSPISQGGLSQEKQREPRRLSGSRSSRPGPSCVQGMEHPGKQPGTLVSVPLDLPPAIPCSLSCFSMHNSDGVAQTHSAIICSFLELG